MKITIIGSGNMGGAIAKGLSQGRIFTAKDITCTARSEKTLDKMRCFNPDFKLTTNNMEAVEGADIIVLAVKPWMVETIIKEISPSLKFDKQIIVSIAAGISFSDLNKFLTNESSDNNATLPVLFRVIPNTAIEVGSSMTFVSACNATSEQTNLVINIFKELGNAILIEERLMSAGTALASCGIAYAFRYIRAAIEGGVELGFYPKEAQEIVEQTVKGAVDLLMKNNTNPECEIDKVTTPGGLTIKGLNEMEKAGFTSAVIQGLKASK